MSEQTQEPIRLFTFPNSPFGAKVYWALQFKGVEFDLTYVNAFTTKELRFTKQGVVPVLMVGEEWVQDSRENCLWLEKLYPNRSFAGTTDADANCAFLKSLCQSANCSLTASDNTCAGGS